MGQANTTSLTFPSKLSEVPAVQQRIIDAAEAADYPKDAVFAIRLALDEALNNAVRHGNCGDETKAVHVDFTVGEKEMSVSIEDEGCGFKPKELPDPTAEENITRPHGRGVMLMNAYMTTVSFNDKGNRVTLTKCRDCDQPKGD